MLAGLIAGCGGDATTSVVAIVPPSSVCGVTLPTRSVSIDADAADGQLTLGMNRECQWTATSDADWMGVSPPSGQGDSSLSYSVTANAAITARRAVIAINDQRVELTQAGAPCRFSLSTTTASVDPRGGRLTVSVTAQAGCAWTAASQVSWITILEGASAQSGNGTRTLSVDANGTTSRSGTVTIANQVVTISQDALPAPVPTCVLTLSASSRGVGSAGGDGTVAVSGAAGCQWSAVSNTSWIAITAGSPGIGAGAVQYRVAANPDALPRSGTIVVAGQGLTVSQDAATPSPGPCAFSVSPTSATIPAAGMSGTITVTASAPTCTWTGSSAAGWLIISAGASGTGSGTTTYVVAANTTTSPRTGTLTIAARTVSVTQPGQPLSLTGKVSGKTGQCPTLTFTVDDRTIRTNGQTSFLLPCGALSNKDKVAITGLRQPDGSVLALTVRAD
ncbi:MAG: BACON domain-containing carbohydrate-binding protein [Acidobacteriota bacterium]